MARSHRPIGQRAPQQCHAQSSCSGCAPPQQAATATAAAWPAVSRHGFVLTLALVICTLPAARCAHLRRARAADAPGPAAEAADTSASVQERAQRSNELCGGGELCCEKVYYSEPYSYFSQLDGWANKDASEVYVQRAAFRLARCISNTGSGQLTGTSAASAEPCRGVQSSLAGRRPACVQQWSEHRMYFYEKSTRQIKSREVRVPSGCACKLVPAS